MKIERHRWVCLEWKPSDMWIGAFWETHNYGEGEQYAETLDVWICLVPMLPIHYSRARYTPWERLTIKQRRQYAAENI